MVYSEAAKRATYSYREKNRNTHLEQNRADVKNHYVKNRNKKITKVLDHYYFLKEIALFRNILITEVSI